MKQFTWILLVSLLAACTTHDPSSVEKMVILQSPDDVETTYHRLQSAIANKGPLRIMAEVPHDQGAASVGQELRPTRLIIFGNPAVGTDFMQADQRVGIDLPMKILVWQDEAGTTQVGYYPATALLQRYSLSDQLDKAEKVNEVLKSLAQAAVSP